MVSRATQCWIFVEKGSVNLKGLRATVLGKYQHRLPLTATPWVQLTAHRSIKNSWKKFDIVIPYLHFCCFFDTITLYTVLTCFSPEYGRYKRILSGFWTDPWTSSNSIVNLQNARLRFKISANTYLTTLWQKNCLIFCLKKDLISGVVWTIIQSGQANSCTVMTFRYRRRASTNFLFVNITRVCTLTIFPGNMVYHIRSDRSSVSGPSLEVRFWCSKNVKQMHLWFKNFNKYTVTQKKKKYQCKLWEIN